MSLHVNLLVFILVVVFENAMTIAVYLGPRSRHILNFDFRDRIDLVIHFVDFENIALKFHAQCGICRDLIPTYASCLMLS